MLISCLTDITPIVATILSCKVNWLWSNPNFKQQDKKTLCWLFTYTIYSSYSIWSMNLSLIAVYRYMYIFKPISKIFIVYKILFIIASQIFIWIASITLVILNIISTVGFYNLIKCDYSHIDTSVSTYSIFILPSIISFSLI